MKKSLIKISDKHSNLRLRFEHPIALNPKKKYKLGVSHLLFSFEKRYKKIYFLITLYQYQTQITLLLLKVTFMEIILLLL